MNRIVPENHGGARRSRSVDLMPRVPWLRKVFVDLLLLALMLGMSFALGVATSLIREPECVLCGSRVAFALWMIAGFALQPPFWAGVISRRRRVEAWAAGFATGVFVYLLVEFAAFLIMTDGNVMRAIDVRRWSDAAGFSVAILVAISMVRRAYAQDAANPMQTGRFSTFD